MSQRRAARHLAGNAGEVNVSQALFFMTNVPFLFQHAKLRPHRRIIWFVGQFGKRSEEHTSELQSRLHLVCRLLLEKKKKNNRPTSRASPTNALMRASHLRCC